MKIVLAPDSFKGSLTAPQACLAMQAGASRVFPDATFAPCPLADGGEGTLDVLLSATGGTARTVRVRGPLDESVEAQWGFLPDGRGIIEMAQASGLTLVPSEKRDAKAASTWGTGQLIKAALTAGCREILVGLGGSATTDGGAGALCALGAVFRDENDVVLRPGGAALSRLHSIDLRYFHEKLQKAHIALLCDVTNPLCGPSGAAHTFGPQKGATPQDVELLEAGLARFAAIAKDMGRDCATQPGAGAAGGLGFGLLAFCNATVHSGIEIVLEALDFEEKLKGADLVLTGEGALDSQTLQGKTIAGVCRAAKAQGVPVIAFGGRVELTESQQNELGVKAAFPIADETRDVDYNLANASSLLKRAVERALHIIKE